jgi:hypothetical protein
MRSKIEITHKKDKQAALKSYEKAAKSREMCRIVFARSQSEKKN